MGGERSKARRVYARAVVEALEPRILMDDTGTDDWGAPTDNGWMWDDTPAETQPYYPPDSGSDYSGGGSYDGGDSSDSGYVEPSYDDSYYTDCGCDDVTISPPSRPGSLTVQAVSNSALYLSWKLSSDDADGFIVYRKDPGTGFHSVAIVGGDKRHYTDVGLQSGTNYSYSIQAFNEGGYSDYSSTVTHATASVDDPTFVGQFGQLPGGSSAAPLSFYDQDGTLVTLAFNGAGTGMLHLNADGYDISIGGTTFKTKLTISTGKGWDAGADGRFEMGSLTIGDASVTGDATGIGSIVAKTTDLSGNLTVTGGVGNVTLGDLLGGNVLTIGASVGVKSVSMALGVVNSATVQSGTMLSKVSAIRWGSGEIDAPSLASLSVTGRGGRTNAVAGDFGADVRLAGATGRGATLGKVSVAGKILGGTWDVAGSVGSIGAKSVAGAWMLSAEDTLTALGSVKSVTLSDKTAMSVGMMIEATSVASVNVAGNLSGARIDLRQGVGRTLALGKFTVRGQLVNSEIRSSGNIGKVSVGVMNHSVLFAGVKDGVTGLPTAGDFVSGDVTVLPGVSSLVVTGYSVAKDAAVFIDSDVAAGTMGKVSLPARGTAVLDVGGVRFGFATVGLPVKGYRGPASVGNFVSGLDSVV